MLIIKAKFTNLYVKINSKSGGFYVKKREKKIHFMEKYAMFRQRVSNII